MTSMKRIVAFILLMLFLSHNTKAQNQRMLSMELSINQIELSFRHNIINERLWTELYAGIGSLDVNRNYDDFTTGLSIGLNVFSNKRNQIALNTRMGICFLNNDYYAGTVPLINAGVRYTRFFGKKENHCLLVSVGYRYGKRNYKQTYSSEIANVSTVGSFKVSPLYLSIGYGFRF